MIQQRIWDMVAKAGGQLMHDGDQHEVVAFREGNGGLERFVARVEREALHRHADLVLKAQAQALHLSTTRDHYILREWVSRQPYAEVTSMDAVEETLARRAEDQSAETNRLRRIATGGSWL